MTNDRLEIPRDRWDRPLIIPPEGGKKVAYQRVTKFVDVVEDTFNISRWELRHALVGLMSRPDLQLMVAAHTDDKSELNKIAESAKKAAGSDASSNKGTALHKLTERVDEGEEIPPLPEPYESDIVAYQAATQMLDIAHIEQFLVNDYVKAAGTADRLYRLGDRLVIGDTKTGSKLDYGIVKIAMQLATYSRAKIYDPETGERSDLGADPDWGIIVHLPAGTGTCELLWVNLQIGWTGVLLAQDVRDFRKLGMKDLTRPVDFEELI